MAEVRLENISKIYEGDKKNAAIKKAVNDISFDVHDKEFMVIVGPSGCGKSTLLRNASGKFAAARKQCTGYVLHRRIS